MGTKRIGARHIGPLARTTPSLKLQPQGATPQLKPPGWWLGRFQPTHAPTQAPYPIALVEQVT
ncbi:hypothetical protein Hanom_Chr12g01169051 [Helianthus anomalus]